MNRQKVFKPLTLKLSSVEDADARKKLETLFDEFNTERAKANEASRRAALADAESGIAMQKARMAFVELLLTAGAHLDPIRVEQVWTTYRKDGEIFFECPFTEMDQRNAMRAQRANVEQAARATGAPVESLWDGDENDDDKTIGFGPRH